jgi:phosphomannomutase
MTIPDGIFKAYDIRGLYPQELDEAAAERVGCALAQQLGASRLGVGMDPRPSSAGLVKAFAPGSASAWTPGPRRPAW